MNTDKHRYRAPIRVHLCASVVSLVSPLRRLHGDRRGAISTEYMMILALIVLPLALLMPMFMGMIRLYGGRLISLLALPVP